MSTHFLLRYRLGENAPWLEHLLTEGEMVLGREPSCTLVFSQPEISRRHASIEVKNGDLWLTDLGSSNGTQVDGRPLPPRHPVLLQLGQPFTIGPYTLVAQEPDRPPTMMRAAEPGIAQSPVDLKGTQLDLEAAAPTGARPLHLSDLEAVTIGRAPDNHVVLDHPVVSRYHAVIERMGARFRLRDLRSANGVFVNGSRIQGQVWLKDSDEIRIGPHAFTLAGGDLRQQAEAGLGIDARGLHRQAGRANLLRDISLVVRPQEIVAIVGMSGAGKTTLLNALSGYRKATKGTVRVAGLDLYRHYDLFRNEIGYVPQRDIVHMELTPQSALDYAAQLRMPPDTTADERRQRVAQVLADLDLTERRNIPINRLSGGQIKRISIGVELLTGPRLFFLDEPTSGLDPGTEYDMMKLLRRLADQGRTILLVTHATKNVMLCDKVVFMARGGIMAFYGPPEEALEYFDAYRTPREQREKEMEFDDIYRILNDESRGTAADWDQRFRAALASGSMEWAADQPAHQDAAKPEKAPALRQGASAWQQFVVLSRRNLQILFQDKISLALMLAIAPVLGLEDFVWGRGLSDPVTGDASKIMMMWFVTGLTTILVGALSSVREIVKETDIYRRERAVNLRVLPYVASKAWVGVVLAAYQAAVLLFFRILFVDPSVPGPLGYAALYVTYFLATLCGYLIGLAISAGAPNQNAAVLLTISVLIPQFLFSGGLLPFDLIPGGEAISVAVPARWSFEAFIRTTGIGDPLAADACWGLPKAERQDLTPEQKADCPCMGENIFTDCSSFPGIFSEDFYDFETKRALEQPQPVEPSQPTPYPSPTPLPTPTSPQAVLDYLAVMQEQGEAYADSRVAQGDDYAGAMRAYGDARAEWQERRERAISSAEGMLTVLYDDFGHAFTGSLLPRWGALLAINAVLLALVFIFQKLKDLL